MTISSNLISFQFYIPVLPLYQLSLVDVNSIHHLQQRFHSHCKTVFIVTYAYRLFPNAIHYRNLQVQAVTFRKRTKLPLQAIAMLGRSIEAIKLACCCGLALLDMCHTTADQIHDGLFTVFRHSRYH